jgi:cardiolipin synthase (CMP-forming)
VPTSMLTPKESPPRTQLLGWVPNALSLSRLGLGLAFPFLPPSWRLGAIVAAALSDLADGAASRLLRANTRLGRILDPVADKVFVIAVLATLVIDGTLYLGDVFLIGMRDLVVGLGGAWLLLFHGRAVLRQFKPTFLGKAATVAQLVFLIALLTYGQSFLLLFLATAGLSILAALDYLRLFLMQSRRSTPACLMAGNARPQPEEE